jgi:hypothetical protein
MKTLTAAWILALAAAASADVIKLKNGGALEGVVLKESEGSVVVRLKYATVTLDRADIESIEKKAAEGPASPKAARLAPWDRCVEVVAARPWAGELRQIPATVIDKGILKNVPYMSHKSGNYEFNLYGDPDAPACLEIGVYKDLLKSEAAKKECLDVMAALLGDAKDAEGLRSLNLAPGKKDREGLTFEVTPETAEDAYGGWWISVYDVKALDAARATDEELKKITVDEDELEKEDEETKEVARKEEQKKDPAKKAEPKKTEPRGYIGFNPYIWQKKDLEHARPQKKSSGGLRGLRRVYVRGFSRPRGGYIRVGGGIRR